MGLFNDNVNATRTVWTFQYRGDELLPTAEYLFKRHSELERKAREQMAAYMLDSNMSQLDPKIADTKKLIEKHGDLKEKLSVWVHEFHRDPAREFELGLGDVTFFELVGPLT